MRFSDRSYRTLALKRPGDSVLGELTLAHHKPSGAEAFVHDVSASAGSYQLGYAGNTPSNCCLNTISSKPIWCAVMVPLP